MRKFWLRACSKTLKNSCLQYLRSQCSKASIVLQTVSRFTQGLRSRFSGTRTPLHTLTTSWSIRTLDDHFGCPIGYFHFRSPVSRQDINEGKVVLYSLKIDSLMPLEFVPCVDWLAVYFTKQLTLKETDISVSFFGLTYDLVVVFKAYLSWCFSALGAKEWSSWAANLCNIIIGQPVNEWWLISFLTINKSDQASRNSFTNQKKIKDGLCLATPRG